MIEIERKFRLSPKKMVDIQHILEKESRKLTPMHQVDQVFLYNISSFKDFEQGMPVMRLRTANGNTQLTYKRAINNAGDCLEHELVVESAETMQRILEEMGYRHVTLVDKTRIEIKKDRLTLALDKVAGLGDFLELEILAEKADSGDAEKTILQKAAEFGLTADDIERKKYDEMLSTLTS